jgi:hypothetical protein
VFAAASPTVPFRLLAATRHGLGTVAFARHRRRAYGVARRGNSVSTIEQQFTAILRFKTDRTAPARNLQNP